MKYLRKEFATLKQAENYLIKLYDKYNHVQLISFPRFSERGAYIFEISRYEESYTNIDSFNLTEDQEKRCAELGLIDIIG